MSPMAPASQDQHRVTVTVKAIAFTNRVPIRFEDELAPGERADEDEEARAWQVKIREQRVNTQKSISRLDEDLRVLTETVVVPTAMSLPLSFRARAISCAAAAPISIDSA